MRPAVAPLTPALWPAFKDLFAPNGAVGGCWCMYWRIGAAYRTRGGAANRADFRARVEAGPPPGLLALDDGRALGWVQVTPRAELPRLDRARNLRRVDDAPVWSLSCLYIRRGHRRQGVATALIHGAVAHARAQGAVALEAYPLDAGATPGSSFTGYASTFVRAGFVEVARHVPARPILRHALA